MIKKNFKTLIITSIIILLPILWAICTYPSLPDQIPCHFSFTGKVDGYMPKWGLLLISPIILLIQWAAVIEANFANKKEELKPNYIQMMSWVMAACSTAFWVVMYCCANGDLITAQKLCPIIVGIMFVVMGNYMPKQKKSRWAGIRVKWTLNDPDNWMKTHRLFGKIGVVCGFVMIGLSFVKNLQVAYAIMAVLMLITISVPMIYSYNLSRKVKAKKEV